GPSRRKPKPESPAQASFLRRLPAPFFHLPLPSPKARQTNARRITVYNTCAIPYIHQSIYTQNPRTSRAHPMTPPALFKALADETRARIVLLITHEQELCVCELTCALNQSQPKISRHLAQLRASGLLADRRQGQWVYYRLHPHLP